MSALESQLYQGLVAMGLMRDPRFDLMRRPRARDPVFVVNDRITVQVKYSTRRAPGPWQFTFSLGELQAIRERQRGDRLHVFVLVCHTEVIAVVGPDDLDYLLDLEDTARQQWLRIEDRPESGLRVMSVGGARSRKIARSHFPRVIYDIAEQARWSGADAATESTAATAPAEAVAAAATSPAAAPGPGAPEPRSAPSRIASAGGTSSGVSSTGEEPSRSRDLGASPG